MSTNLHSDQDPQRDVPPSSEGIEVDMGMITLEFQPSEPAAPEEPGTLIARQQDAVVYTDRLTVTSARRRKSVAADVAEHADGDPGEVESVLLEFAEQLLREREDREASVEAVADGETASPSTDGKEPSFEPEMEEVAEELLREPNLLESAVKATSQLGHIGEEENRKMVLLSAVSGLTARTHEDAIHLVIKGESSSGKNDLVKRILGLLPDDEVTTLTGLSEQALVYTMEEEISGVLVLQEAEAQKDAEYMLRQAMSEGELRRLTVSGDTTVELNTYVKGSIITTTTAPDLDHENETRLFVLETDDSEELTRAVLDRAAAEAAGESSEELDPEEIRKVWRCALTKLEPAEVAIPYAERIAEAFPTGSVRARRDIKRVFNLIRSCTILHQRTRPQDGEGMVKASVEDYAMVYSLIQATLPSSMTGLTEKAVQIDELLRELHKREIGSMVPRQKLVEIADRRGVASHNTVDKWAKRFVKRAYWDSEARGRRVFYAPRRNVKHSPLPLPKPQELTQSADPNGDVGPEDGGGTGGSDDDPNGSAGMGPDMSDGAPDGPGAPSTNGVPDQRWDDWDRDGASRSTAEKSSQSIGWEGVEKPPPDWKCLDCGREVPPGRDQCARCAFGLKQNHYC